MMVGRKRNPKAAKAPGTDRSWAIPIAPGPGAVRPLKTAERVARDIVHEIAVRRLQPGDALPAEADMIAQYGVSRESLREALRLLEVQGLIGIRRGPGGGPSVGTVDPANLGRISTLYFELAGGTYRELFEVWIDSERLLAERAARHPDAAHRTEVMKPFLEGPLPGAPRAAKEAYIEELVGFHGAVASLCGNRVLELMLQAPGQIVTHHASLVTDPRDLHAQLEHDHLEIARAVTAGHARRAGESMRAHLDSVAALYVTQLGDDLDSRIAWR